MQSFEELLEQDNMAYSVSGHYFDSGMNFGQMLEFYRRRDLREESNVEFIGAAEPGSKFFIDDLVYVSVYHPPRDRRVAQAKELGIEGLKSHVEIHPGKEYYRKDGLNAARQELKLLLQHHVDQRIPATCYVSYGKEFQGINRV